MQRVRSAPSATSRNKRASRADDDDDDDDAIRLPFADEYEEEEEEEEEEEAEEAHHEKEDESSGDDADKKKKEGRGGGVSIDFGSRLRPTSFSSCGRAATTSPDAYTLMVMDVIVRRRRGGFISHASTGRGAMPREHIRRPPSTEALLIGRAADGASVCVAVDGWQPYLLVRAPPRWKDACDRNDALRALLEARLETYYELRAPSAFEVNHTNHTNYNNNNNGGGRRRGGGAASDGSIIIWRITAVPAKSIYGYSEEGVVPFLKLEVVAPFHVNALRDVLVGYPLEKGGRAPGAVIALHPSSLAPELRDGQSETFNSNLDATQQFMVDVGLAGCQWVRINDARRRRRCAAAADDDDDDADAEPYSSCDRECRASIAALEILDLEAAPTLAPLRVLSFDIEAAGRRGVFPQPDHDPVIQIALHFHVVGADSAAAPIAPLLLSLRACDPIDGADVVAFEDEAQLLRAFRDAVIAFDADVFTGYNIANFDWKYLVDRAAVLGGVAAEFPCMTRLVGHSLSLRETEYMSAQTGKRKRVRVTIPGRVGLDMLTVIQNSSHRLERYTLNAVSAYFLNDSKEDIPFTRITPMWQEGSASRRELGIYCLKDAQLPLALMAKLDALTGTVEMARSVGVPFDWVLQRGVMVRNTSLLLRRARSRNLVFPNLSPFARQPGVAPRAPAIGRDNRYVGATVLEPDCGIHRNVVVLDFSAMYPSLIRAHNLCYSTIVLDETHPFRRKQSDADDEARGLLRVCGHTFVSEDHFRGLVPEVVKHLQDCRSKAKKALAAATDPMQKQVIKARELAYKIAGNGVYGALGSTLALLPLLAVAESVTALGRRDIEMVKGVAARDGRVVYGDTDSVFVAVPLAPELEAVTADAIAELSRVALALAARVNARLKAPKQIEYEKTFTTMLLLTKKRYAGLKYEAGFRFDGSMCPSIDAKGVQSVRRDGCPLVRELVGEIIHSVLGTGAEVDAAALVRRRLVDIVEDRLPLEQYAIKKTLRKSLQDCALPMTPAELNAIRAQLTGRTEAAPHPPQLSYAEVDAAIHARIKLPFRRRIKLPHVELAWRMRLRDPGSAPVPGESIAYVLTHNGTSDKCHSKVETLDAVRVDHIPVDRTYYLKALRTPIESLFTPIITQRLVAQGCRPVDRAARTQLELDRLIWDIIRGRRLAHDPATRRAAIEHSPLARAFARQRTAAAAAGGI